jgi:hypothetical protein
LPRAWSGASFDPQHFIDGKSLAWFETRETTIPAYTINGFTRPELHLNAAGQIILDGPAAEAAAAYGLKFLYLGVPASTPYPPVPDFDLV